VKHTADQSQTLSFDNRTYTIPPNTIVIANIPALHTHPRYWGPDPLLWRPGRWIVSPKSGDSIEAVLAAETLVKPVKGSYIPWSEGERVCPGRKFSQVEFVGVMVGLFHRYRAEVVTKGEESAQEARRRTQGVVEDSELRVVVNMRKPESVALRLVKNVQEDG
jgi:cytochrome P450